MSKQALADAQMDLVPRQTSVYAPRGEEILELLNRALKENRISQEVLAQATAKDPSHLSRMLAGKGAHPSLDVIAAVIGMDPKRVFIRGLSALCGGEWTPTKEDPAAEVRRLREDLLEIQNRLEHALRSAR